MNNLNLRVPQSGVNAFGFSIYPIKDLLSNKKVESYVRSGVAFSWSDIGLEDSLINEVIDFVIQNTIKFNSLFDYEKTTREYLEKKGVIEKIPLKIKGRAEKMADIALKNMVGGSVLDLGCGPGKVGKLISEEGFGVILADVYENENIQKLGLPFVKVAPDQNLPF